MAKRKRITEKAVQSTENLPVLPKVTVKPEVDEDSWGDDCLTLKQRLFVKFYVGEAGGNASKAARLAGYRDDNNESLRQTASQTLTLPHVQRAIERELGSRFGSTEEIKNSIRAIANSNAADYLDRRADGKLIPNLEKMAEAGALGLIQQYQGDVTECDGKITTTAVKLKLYDRLKALEILAKMGGILVEKSEVKVKGELDVNHNVSSAMKKIMSDPAAFEGAVQLADRLKALEANAEPGRN